MIGFVGVRHEFQYTVIDIDFTNKNFHRNLSINDDFGIKMAALNYTGILMASMAEEKNFDEYEEDELESDGEDAANTLAKRRKCSNIQFKALNEFKDIKEWSY